MTADIAQMRQDVNAVINALLDHIESLTAERDAARADIGKWKELARHNGDLLEHARELNSQQFSEMLENIESLTAERDKLLAAIQQTLPFLPKSSASDGGAAKYSEAVHVADAVRAAIASLTARPSAGKGE